MPVENWRTTLDGNMIFSFHHGLHLANNLWYQAELCIPVLRFLCHEGQDQKKVRVTVCFPSGLLPKLLISALLIYTQVWPQFLHTWLWDLSGMHRSLDRCCEENQYGLLARCGTALIQPCAFLYRLARLFWLSGKCSNVFSLEILTFLDSWHDLTGSRCQICIFSSAVAFRHTRLQIFKVQQGS